MRKFFLRALSKVLCAAALAAAGAALAADTPLGRWEALDDKGEAYAWMEVAHASDGAIEGRLLRPNVGMAPNARCDGCEGDLKGTPITGLPIAFAFRAESTSWRGQVRDARTGRTYSGVMRMRGAELELRGYVGTEVFGQSQVWRRLDGSVPSP
jgi:uncharacterized protein (DUF2147 family)